LIDLPVYSAANLRMKPACYQPVMAALFGAAKTIPVAERKKPGRFDQSAYRAGNIFRLGSIDH
jgi:hypothetical protein